MNRTALALRVILTALVLLAALPSRAMLPENGWYWHPAESGRGFNLEIQDNVLFLAAFVYRPDGPAVWYTGGGAMTSDRTWSADLYETANGQCIGCTYSPPAYTHRGSVSITFTSERSATISLLGSTLNVVRMDWTNVGAASRDALFGEWSTTEGDPAFPVYFGDRISLYVPRSDSSGTYAAGNRTGSSTSVAVGTFNAGTGLHAILLDSSTSYYSLFLFTMNTFNRVEGRTWTYLKNSSPTGNGLYFLAHRTKSYTRVRGFNGPGVTKAAAGEPDHEAIDAIRASQSMMKASVSAAGDGISLEALQRTARELEVQLGLARS
jgi:hypothetical protein